MYRLTDQSGPHDPGDRQPQISYDLRAGNDWTNSPAEDHIALPRIIPGPGRTDNERLLKLALLGHLIGDGCTLASSRDPVHDQGKRLGRTSSRSCNTGIWRRSPATSLQGAGAKWYQVFIPTTRQITHGVRNPVSEWLDESGQSSASARMKNRFPPRYLISHPSDRRVLAASLGDRRMHPTIDKLTAAYPAVYYAYSSEGLARDVQSLLLRLGINARLKSHRSKRQGSDSISCHSHGTNLIFHLCEQIGAIGAYKTTALSLVSRMVREQIDDTNRKQSNTRCGAHSDACMGHIRSRPPNAGKTWYGLCRTARIKRTSAGSEPNGCLSSWQRRINFRSWLSRQAMCTGIGSPASKRTVRASI